MPASFSPGCEIQCASVSVLLPSSVDPLLRVYCVPSQCLRIFVLGFSVAQLLSTEANTGAGILDKDRRSALTRIGCKAYEACMEYEG